MMSQGRRTSSLQQLAFTKMHELGHDFMAVDAISQPFRITPELVQSLSDRHYGVGFDQLLVVEPPGLPDADFRCRIFNADGSEALQRGTGARCFARFVRDRRLTSKKIIRVESARGLLELHVGRDGWVAVGMGPPELEPVAIPFVADRAEPMYSVAVADQTVALSAVSMGNPHGVVLVENLDTAPVTTLGPVLAQHPRFPAGANISFAQIEDRNSVRLRVFERDAGETPACDSAACATVVCGRLRGLLDERVRVTLPGGTLIIEWQGQGAPVIMEGPTASVFEGQIRISGRPRNRSRS